MYNSQKHHGCRGRQFLRPGIISLSPCLADSGQQEPSLAPASPGLSYFTALPSSPPGRVPLCSSTRASILGLWYGSAPRVGAPLGQASVLRSLVTHPHHPILSRELGEHWVPILAVYQNHTRAYCCLFIRAFLVFAFVFKICGKIKPHER